MNAREFIQGWRVGANEVVPTYADGKPTFLINAPDGVRPPSWQMLDAMHVWSSSIRGYQALVFQELVRQGVRVASPATNRVRVLEMKVA